MGQKRDLSEIDAELEGLGKSDEDLERVKVNVSQQSLPPLSEVDAELQDLGSGRFAGTESAASVSDWPEDGATEQTQVPEGLRSDSERDAEEEFVLLVDDDAFEELSDEDIEEIDLEADLVEYERLNSQPPPKTTENSFLKKLFRSKG